MYTLCSIVALWGDGVESVVHGIGGCIESVATNGKAIGKQLHVLANEQSVVMAECIEFDTAIHRIDWSAAIVDVVELIVVDVDRLVMLQSVK